MVREVPERWKAIGFASVVLAAVAALWVTGSALNTPPSSRTVQDVTLSLEGAGWTTVYHAAQTGNSTAFSILLEAGDRMGFRVTWIQYGAPLASVIVDSINGTKSGDGGRWWQYWVDGAYGDVGADHKPLADGSEVLWAFREYPPREA